MTPTEAGVRELCANTRENMHLHLDLRVCKLASADIRVLTMFLLPTFLLPTFLLVQLTTATTTSLLYIFVKQQNSKCRNLCYKNH